MKKVTRFISAVMVALLLVTSIQMPVVSASSWEDDYFNIEVENDYYELEYGQIQELQCKLSNIDYEEIKDLSDYKIEWEHEGEIIPNATSTSYVVDTKQAGSKGYYKVEVTKGECSREWYFNIEVDTQLSYEGDWYEDYYKSLGESVVLDAKATSMTNKLTYKWEKADLCEGNFRFDYENMKPLKTTASEITFDQIAKEDYGSYTCTISDGINETERTFDLIPDSNLSIFLEGDEERIVGIGESVTMEISAYSNYDIEYQWYKGKEPIKGATTNKYTIDSMQKENYGEYTCKVKDEYYTFTQEVVLKSFDLASAAEYEIGDYFEKSYTGFVGESLTIEVNGITKAPGTELTFTWMKNADRYGESTPEVIKGVTTDRYTIPVLEEKSESNTNEYKVIVTDGVTEQVMYIPVNAQRYAYFVGYENRIFDYYESRNIHAEVGKKLSINLLPKVQQGYKVRYQWFMTEEDYGDGTFQTGEKIAGQTSPTLTIPSVKESYFDKKFYCVAYITTKDGVVTKNSGVFELIDYYEYDEY